MTFQKGQSGNPGGKNGHFGQMMSMARAATPEATQKLIELVHDDDPRVAGWAADKVLERAWGKPKDYDPAADQPDNPPIDPAQFSPQQRAQLRRMLELLLKAMPAENVGSDVGTIDAEPQESK